MNYPQIGQIIKFKKPNGIQIATVNRLYESGHFEVVYFRGHEKRAMVLSVFDHFVIIPKAQYYCQKIATFGCFFVLFVTTFSFWMSVLSNWFSSCLTTEMKSGWLYGYSVITHKNCENFWKAIVFTIFDSIGSSIASFLNPLKLNFTDKLLISLSTCFICLIIFVIILRKLF